MVPMKGMLVPHLQMLRKCIKVVWVLSTITVMLTSTQLQHHITHPIHQVTIGLVYLHFFHVVHLCMIIVMFNTPHYYITSFPGDNEQCN